jgi:hypothetical protein
VGNRLHPLFLYLITDKRVPLRDIKSKHQLYVGLSSQPFVHLECQNRTPGYRAGVKVTKSVSPHWELQLVVPIQSDAKAHKTAWRKARENKLLFLLRYLYQLALSKQTSLFCRDANEVKSLLARSGQIHFVSTK